MKVTPDPRLQRLLGTAALADVRRRLRRQFERIEPGATLTSLRLEGLDPEANAALCQLTGSPSRAARSMTVDVIDLDARLRAGGLADSLRDALERLEGPIVAKAFERREMEKRWSAVAASGGGDARLLAWLRTAAALTLLKRLGRDPGRAARLLTDAAAVLSRLPASGVTRSQLAAETLGDAHALDGGRPVATLVLAVWRHYERSRLDRPLACGTAGGDTAAVENEADATPAAVDRNERSREVWARAGVLVNELARPVLCLNLPSGADTAGIWTSGEPAYLSLRQLLRQAVQWSVAQRRVFVCENPNVVAIAADRLGAACAPLICTDGMPAAAQRTLLDQLAAAGARLQYHGDYDWAGIGIANFVLRNWQAEPWRFGVADYLAAIARVSSARTRDLDATMIEASWDRKLGEAMREHGVAIAEEAVMEGLFEDLRCEER
jgi:uncharacterized protein (TIGR02679 family)